MNDSDMQAARDRCPASTASWIPKANRVTNNTLDKARWAYNQYQTWRSYRIALSADEGTTAECDLLLARQDHLDKFNDAEMDLVLSCFITEVRKQKNKERYPAQTLYELVSSLKKHLAINFERYARIPDSLFFPKLSAALEKEMKISSTAGLGAEPKKADVITEQIEETLWSTGVMGTDGPLSLLRAVFYAVASKFQIFGSSEHRALRLSNFTFHDDPELGSNILYSPSTTVSAQEEGEIISGRKPTGVNRTIRVYAEWNSIRCPVRIIKLYMRKCPIEILKKAFYLRPVPNPKSDIWFSSHYLGLHSIESMIKDMVLDAGVQGYFTNGSLRYRVKMRMLHQGDRSQAIGQSQPGISNVTTHKRPSEEKMYHDGYSPEKKIKLEPGGSDISGSYMMPDRNNTEVYGPCETPQIVRPQCVVNHPKKGSCYGLAQLQVTVEPKGSSAYVFIPTLSFDDVDRTGNINAWRIQKMMTMARMAAYHVPNLETGDTFLEYDRFTSNFYTYMASVETEVAREFYDLLQRDQWPGVGISFHLGYMGSASLNTVATLKDPTTDKALAWNTNTVVCVDKTTRKPAMIPDWWRNKYKGEVKGNIKLLIPPLQVPEETSHYQVKVPWCDVDAYKHTNYLAYVRFCLDAAMDAISEGRFPVFENDIFNYHVRKLKILYIGETLAGDIIDVRSWQDASDPYMLNFAMKRGSKDVFQSTMAFYES